MKKIDIHLHCLGEKRAPLGPSQIPSRKDILDGLFLESGTKQGILMATPSNLPMEDTENLHELFVEANEIVQGLAEESEGRFQWMCCLDPREAGLEQEDVLYDRLEEYKKAGAVGFGEAYAPLWVDEPKMQKIYGCLEKLEMPILMHMSAKPMQSYGLADDPGLPRLEKMLKAYPNLKFIGHSQVFWSELGQDCPEQLRVMLPGGRVKPGRVPELLENYPNLYADLSAMSGFNALSRDIAYTVSFLNQYQDKIMYGSDMLLPRFCVNTDTLLDSLKELHLISEEVWEKICNKNAAEIFGLN